MVEALREIYTTVKIKATCLLYDILYHVLIIMMYDESRLNKFIQGVEH